MSDRSKNEFGSATALLYIVLLAGGGVGFYYFNAARQRTAAREAEVVKVHTKVGQQRAHDEAVAEGSGQKGEGTLEPTPAPGDDVSTAVGAVLHAQQEAWNRGDVEAFMEHYWKSDDLTFSSGGKTTRGWNATLDCYRERYPTREKMGRLSFSGLEVSPLGDSAALVLGQWKLDRDSEPVEGNFSLVLRKVDERWVVVHDHTSRLGE